jgi:D-amino-acid dehydrogenase
MSSSASEVKSVVVIGGGIIGLSCAWEAARSGMQVTIIDRQAEHEDTCSNKNAGMIVPSHIVPLAAPGMISLGLKMLFQPGGAFAIRPRLSADLIRWGLQFIRSANAGHVKRSAPLLRDLHLASRQGFLDWQDRLGGREGGDFGLVTKGLFMLCQTQAALDHEASLAELSRELGVPAEVIDANEVARLDPGADVDIQGAVYFPQDCHLRPHDLLAALKAELVQLGAEFRWQTEACGWRKSENGSTIEALKLAGPESNGAGEWQEADAFVLAGGAWSPESVKDLDLRMPMQAGKGYSVTLPNPPQLPEICSLLTEARVAVTPVGESLRIAGTMEIAGLDRSINRSRLRGIFSAVPRYYPAFADVDFDELEVWSGLRPCSPDGLPYLGRAKNADNLIVATGHAMIGLSLAPVTGKLVGEMLRGEALSIGIEALAPGRFSR